MHEDFPNFLVVVVAIHVAHYSAKFLEIHSVSGQL